ncbi:L-threonine ammonia-lyase-like, partial [Saccoglossus kowalevskii]|uniref:L-serine deaminase n=1 Tax=Saccoglossus kowalevskii TaxID=10224 RepID=A0ABM0M4J1_SACKO
EFGTEYISPYNDMDVIIGSETIGFEILENLPHVDAVFVPVGGGGLISGIAAYIKAIKPSVQIIGCQSEVNNAMQMCVDAGKIEDFELQDTICDGVAGGVETNSVTFDICKSYVDKWITCSEEATAKGVMFMMEHHHRVIETSGALPIAAFLSVADEYKDKNVVLVISGCNISIDKIKYILNEYHNS